LLSDVNRIQRTAELQSAQSWPRIGAIAFRARPDAKQRAIDDPGHVDAAGSIDTALRLL